MGNCCGSSRKNEGIPIDVYESVGPIYKETNILTENDLKIIMKRIYTIQYNSKLYEKRSLQAQRANALKKELGNEYLQLVIKSQTFEKNILDTAKKEALKALQVDTNAFNKIYDSINITDVKRMAMNAVFERIRDKQDKLGLSESAYSKLMSRSEIAYDECDFQLNSHPDIALQLSNAYDEDSYFSCEDVMMADKLYSEFRLLPIEIYAFIDEE